MIQWSDLKRFDALIREAEALGACVEEIGISGRGTIGLWGEGRR